MGGPRCQPLTARPVKAAGVVQGYLEGYHPNEIVNRAQMAAYIAGAFSLPL